MRVIKFVMGLFILIAPLVMAQDMQWQSMEGPYYVYDVTGISSGKYGTQTLCAYAIGSDLEATKIYRYEGSSPIEQWGGWVELQGAKHVSSSKENGRNAYATVPEQEGIPGQVWYTVNGGQTWSPTLAQPGDKAFTCIETHPTNPNICFTGGENTITANSSAWRTVDGGERWSEAGPTFGADPRYKSYSVRIDPNSGTSVDNTTIYICYDRLQGIWRNKEGGNGTWDALLLPDYDYRYDGIDIAIKKGDSQDIYLLAKIYNLDQFQYTLWHSTDGGARWVGEYNLPGPFRNFGTEPVSKIMVSEYNRGDVLWIISPTAIYTYLECATPHIWGTAAGDYQCFDLDIDSTEAPFQLYAGYKSYISRVNFNWSPGEAYFHFTETNGGTNITNISSLNCMVGGHLDALTSQGGFVFDYSVGLMSPNQWRTLDCFEKYQTDPANGDVIGDRLTTCYIDEGNGFVASGHDNSSPYLSENGLAVSLGNETPSLFKAIAGPMVPSVFRPNIYVGGKAGNANVAYAIMHPGEPYYIDVYSSWGENPPVIQDMICERSHLSSPFYACGTRTSNGQDIVLRISNDTPPVRTSMNEGIDDVLKGNSIIKSPEIHAQDLYPIMYLGTEKGVYKTNLDDYPLLPWRKVSTGINQDIEIIDLANYGQGINYASGIPDSLIEYALGKDANGQSYIYISADSGRSWVEDGGYLRDHALTANAITTISDISNNNQAPYYLAVGTNRGVYRYPYNVKSGTITQNETWGPGLVIVNGDITIPASCTLEIVAPCTVLVVYDFDITQSNTDHNRSEIIVHGNLTATGTSDNPIVFTSSKPTSPRAGDWSGIFVYNGGSISLKHCAIEYANTAITASGGASVSILYSNINLCRNAGFWGTGACTPNYIIQYCTFFDCSVYGIMCSNGSPQIESNTILGNNQYGIKYLGGGSPVIGHNVISTTNTTNSQWGIYIAPNSISDHPSPGMTKDSVMYYRQGGIYFSGVGTNGILGENIRSKHNGTYGLYLANSSPTVNGGNNTTHNTFNENGYYGIYCDKGSNGTFRWNSSKENRYCVYIQENANPDFGTASDSGFNSFKRASNYTGSYDMYSLNRNTINAIGNYWNGNIPRLYGSINTRPLLLTDPIPGMEKRRPETIAEAIDLSIANYPNPFNTNTEIKFGLVQSGQVSVKVFDISGRLVKELANNTYDAGEHTIIWDGTNSSGQKVSSGVYLYSISTAQNQITKKMVMSK